MVESGYDGLLVPKNDVEGLAAGLEALMGDAQLRSRLGQAARERTEREFSGTAYLQMFEELVAATLAAARAGSAPSASATR